MLQINLLGVLVSCDGDGSYHEIPKSIPSDTVYLSMVNFNFGALQRANFTRLKTVECMIIMDSGKTISFFEIFGEHMSFCGATDSPVLDFWFQSQNGQSHSHLIITELF